MPLTASPNLSSFKMAAGEPFVVRMSVTPDGDSRSFVMTVYGPNRTMVEAINGEYDDGFFEFVRDGDWSEGLYGERDLKVEIAERLSGGKSVIASPVLDIEASALGVTKYSNGIFSRSAVLITLADDDSGLPVATATQIPYAENVVIPAVYMMNFAVPKNAAYAGAML